jgi:hypothetical protein
MPPGSWGVPDPMAGLWISMAGRHGVEASLDLERDEFLLAEASRRLPESTFIEELALERSALLAVIDELGHAREVERVLVLVSRERMHRVSAVAMKIVPFRRWDQEGEESALGDQWTHRVHARPAVGSYRGKEGEANTELIHQRATRGSEFGLGSGEVLPSEHR